MTQAEATDYRHLHEQRRAEVRGALRPLVAGHERIVLEIGCGHGHFLEAYAAAHPDVFCLGIDLMSDRIRRGTRKKERSRLANLAFLHASASDLLAALPEHVKLGAIFVLFPDPWPKRRHWKNRLVQPEFLDALADHAVPGAPFHFRTDHVPYFEEARAVVAAHPKWKLAPSTAVWPFEFTTVFQARAPSYQSLIAHRIA